MRMLLAPAVSGASVAAISSVTFGVAAGVAASSGVAALCASPQAASVKTMSAARASVSIRFMFLLSISFSCGYSTASTVISPEKPLTSSPPETMRPSS